MTYIRSSRLRTENVLFIDDNPANIDEVRYYLPDIQTLSPENLSMLRDYAEQQKDEETPGKRLNQYKILEAKTKAHESVSSNEEFLRQSEIQIFIEHDCESHNARIVELIARTNQLNFTKNRMNESEIASLLKDSGNDCAVISAKDRYGDYGIIGFYCLNKSSDTLIHFLFSCRVLGMGIEQYVYELLGFPELKVTGEVAVQLEKNKMVNWITMGQDTGTSDSANDSDTLTSSGDIFMKGPCDVGSIIGYIKAGKGIRIDTEFNYPDDNGVIIAGHHITAMIRQSRTLDRDTILRVANDSGFYSSENFKTRLFDAGHKAIIMSMLPDGQEGIYVHNATGIKIGFSSGNHSLCDPNNWENFKKDIYTNHNVAFTDEMLEKFRSNFTFRGFMDPHETAGNVAYIRENLPDDCLLILLLGSEIECPESNTNFTDLHINHKAANDELYRLFRDSSNVRLINVTKHIRSVNDYQNHFIDHYSRRVYYELAQEIVRSINEQQNLEVLECNAFMVALFKKAARRIKRAIKVLISRR